MKRLILKKEDKGTGCRGHEAGLYSRLRTFIERLLRRYREGEPGEIFYINGPDVLPPPLGAEEEARMIDELATNEQARVVLIE